MKKTKIQILLTIITLLISTTMFANRVDAYQAMTLKCNITKSKYSEENLVFKFKFHNMDGERIFVRLTDNSGNPYWNYLENISSIQTIPRMPWIKNVSISQFLSMEEEEKNKYVLDQNATFNAKYCPQHILKYDLVNPATHFLQDTSTPLEEPYSLEETKYVIYSYTDDEGNKKYIAEGYNNEGAYCFVGPDVTLSIKDEITGHQERLIYNTDYVGYDKYFKVDEIYASLLIAGNGVNGDYSVCENHSKEWCKNYKDFKIYVASAGEGKKNLDDKISDWINDKENQNQFRKYDDIINIVNDEDFMNILEEINESLSNGKEYNFSNINIDELISKLKKAIPALDSAFDIDFTDCGYEESKTDITSSVTSCLVYSDMLGIRNFLEMAEEESTENFINKGYIISALYNDVHDSLVAEFQKKNYKIDILNASEDLTDYVELMYTATAYLKSKSDELNIDKNKIEDIYNGYSNLVDKYNLDIYPVVDCESLLGEDLINKIKSYLNIIKIAIPIILIGLGIVDFTKAIFAGDDDTMKKAQKQFIKRLAIAILIFFTPTLLNLLLSIANKVWSIISPNSCGIF